MKYLIETHGCQMNVHDSERMAGLLEQAGEGGHVESRRGGDRRGGRARCAGRDEERGARSLEQFGGIGVGRFNRKHVFEALTCQIVAAGQQVLHPQVELLLDRRGAGAGTSRFSRRQTCSVPRAGGDEQDDGGGHRRHRHQDP